MNNIFFIKKNMLIVLKTVKRHESIWSSSSYGYIVGQTEFSSLGYASYLRKGKLWNITSCSSRSYENVSKAMTLIWSTFDDENIWKWINMDLLIFFNWVTNLKKKQSFYFFFYLSFYFQAYEWYFFDQKEYSCCAKNSLLSRSEFL